MATSPQPDPNTAAPTVNEGQPPKGLKRTGALRRNPKKVTHNPKEDRDEALRQLTANELTKDDLEKLASQNPRFRDRRSSSAGAVPGDSGREDRSGLKRRSSADALDQRGPQLTPEVPWKLLVESATESRRARDRGTATSPVERNPEQATHPPQPSPKSPSLAEAAQMMSRGRGRAVATYAMQVPQPVARGRGVKKVDIDNSKPKGRSPR